MAEDRHKDKEFDMELFLSICERYGLSKKDIFKDINKVESSIDAGNVIIPKKATNMDILKIMYPNIQWDNECNGIIYGFKKDDRALPMLGIDLDWANNLYKDPT